MNTLTPGEEAVGLNFNPSGSDSVHFLKKMIAEFIDELYDMAETNDSEDVRRMIENAYNRAIEAQMWAVKAATWES